jgi:hypothetical protein
MEETTKNSEGRGTLREIAKEFLRLGVCGGAASLHIRSCGAKLRVWTPLQTMDIALVRAMRITEKLNLQVRAEAFNALNHTNLGTPNRYVNEPQFGTITMAMTPGRQIQLSARLSF